MKKIGVLGPENTYSDIACKKYLKENNLQYEQVFYPSILSTALSIEDNNLAILPFENSLDGFVMEALDQIINTKLHIISQVSLNIDFAFVTNASSLEVVNNCYVQFKSYGQCLDFIKGKNFNIIRTQSNTESAILLSSSDTTYGAIIPMHLLEENSYNIVIPNIADSRNNQTRFFIVEKRNVSYDYEYENLEASIVVTAKEDRPGILFGILKEIQDLNINLKSIVSRPLKTEMGRYKFYFECCLKESEVFILDKLIRELSNKNDVYLLGVYNKL